ncbi:hypothetical protein JIQ42_06749 [Leishmania sp. Namibia]|uniref:hypothetical protein n=1 Tax=Leishmania sp. Namibia TaxID=2802991 RepID=UPI001B5D66AC|nr:hypothetical protein JIQ42_06749 [Leishmania sp. Namibia]
MPSSLAGEIAQLHELFKLGALTQEEFNDAKQATIHNFKAAAAGTAPSAPAPALSSASLSESPACLPPSPAEQQLDSGAPPADTAAEAGRPLAPPSLAASRSVTTEAATHSRTFAEWKELWDSAPVCPSAASGSAPLDPIDARMQALRCLSRLLRNVQMCPLEPKYGRVRESNRIIAHELMCVAKPSRAVLSFSGFVRERDEKDTSLDASSADAEAYCWALPRYATAAAVARKAAASVHLVDELLAYFGEQQSRRYQVQQLWNSVALEVRLERASRGADPGRLLLDVSSDPEEANSKEGESENGTGPQDAASPSAESEAPSPPQALLSYLVECYTVDEAGDGLYSSMQHLQTLQRLYSEAAAASINSGARPSSTHSLLRTAEVYSAVVQQRGAVELLVYGCGARLHPPPVAAQRILAAAASPRLVASSTPCRDAATDYTVQLIPSETPDVSKFLARCLRLLRRLRREVERVQQERSRAARQAAEVSMRQELKRERQRRQLELSSRREGMPVDEQGQTRHQRQRRRTHLQQHGAHRSADASSSSSSTDACGDAVKRKGQRIPLSEALAVLMGKKSPPSRRSPHAELPS